MRLGHFDLNLFVTLDALLETRSISRAAERLHIGASATSSALGRLREHFKDELLVQVGRRMELTPLAETLRQPVRDVLLRSQATLATRSDFDPSRAMRRFVINASDYATTVLLAPLAAQLEQVAPGVTLDIVSLGNYNLEQLERGEVDLALTTPEAAPPSVHARPLFDERYVCVARAGHPAMAAGALTLDAFCALDQALVSYGGSPFEGVTDRALAALGRQRRVVASVGSFLMLPELLRRTDLIALAPARLIEGERDLVSCAPPLAVPGFTKLAVWHERRHRDAGQRWARERLFELC